ncbi:copper amine oxidase-like protein [Tumebacillus sp. BK434]|uniref:stalk domain-containing protein n=1 Tax=Tumebacillus sp. BK434 TaxID=2512169 RepID=UPI001052021F|nr:copper amine oxidase N-terminal domain-containing protein [Tumebacillus sp. BK434]TCP59015.1 copper amine oxidase-like protein [Tumebacillus sp. BK434]
MTKKHRRKFVTLLLACALFAAFLPTSPDATAAERPAASQVSSGHLLIGTYLIQKEALTKPVLDAAKASMDQSDQGIYYKSELADGAWFNIQNGFDLSAILNPSGTTVTNADIDKMTISVWVHLVAGKPIAEWTQTPAELDKAIADAKAQQAKAEADNKAAVEAGDDTLAIQLSLKAATLKAQVDFLEALKAGKGDQAAAELEKLADPEKLLAESVKGAQADLQKKLEADLKKAEDELNAATDPAEKAKLLQQKQLAEDNLDAFKANALSSEADTAKAASLQVAQDLSLAVNNSQTQKAQDLLSKLDAADQQVLVLHKGLLTQQVAALEKKIKAATDFQAIQKLQAELAATKQAAYSKEKAAWEAEVKVLEPAFQTADKLGQKEMAALLLAKLNTIQARLDELQAEATATRIASRQAEIADLNKQIREAKAAGSADIADQLLVPLVQAEGRLAADQQGVADTILDIESAIVKVNAKLKTAGTEEAVLLKQELAVLNANLLKAQMTELFLLKGQVEKKQAEVKVETGKESARLAPVRQQYIKEITAIEKQKYSASDLADLAALQKQIKKEQPKATVLPAENVIAESVDIKFMMPPVILDGRTLIHIRPISESFGSTVLWNNEERSVWISNAGTTVYCKIGDKMALVNGKPVTLDAPPRLIAGRTVVPLRFVVEALGLNVAWDEQSQTIEIKGTVNR